jgi:large subunit ribosomal protein L34e
MPEPRYRSRSKRRKKVVTPSGKNKIHYIDRTPSTPVCALCHGKLKGVPRASKVVGRNLNKVQKRPERMYGGYLCSQCLKQELKKNARKEMKS